MVMPKTNPMPVPSKYTKGRIYRLPCDALKTDPNQPRKHFDPKKLKDLTNSIKEHGLLHAILFRQDEDDHNLYVVAGERRLRAAKEAGLKTIPSVFVDGHEGEIALVENLQREDLNAIELAEHLKQVMTDYDYSQDDLGRILSKSKSTISEILSLNDLPENIRNDCRKDPNISRRTLLTIVKKETAEQMQTAFKRYKENEGKTQPKPKLRKTAFDKFESKLHGVMNFMTKVNYTKMDKETRMNLVSQIEVHNKEMTDLINRIKMMDDAV
jgi:ParB family chromosome partitioning protein